MDEMDHLGSQDVAVVQHPRELCKRATQRRRTPAQPALLAACKLPSPNSLTFTLDP